MDRKPKVLVTGASGQLGQCLQEVVEKTANQEFEFFFKSSSEMDILDSKGISDDFKENRYNYCINCAAYTQVDKAETEVETASKVNVDGARSLALACKEVGAVLIHISTDFVFDGSASIPYSETSSCNPLGVYGQTKLEGENAISAVFDDYFILRTSWLYSEFGNNFMKTMLRLGNERKELSVVADQRGTPTYAKDLADVILYIVSSGNTSYGIYHFSNEGETTWYGFAKAIFDISEFDIDLRPINTEAYPTPARRPKYSVLDKTKIKETLGIRIRGWEEGLEEALMANSSMTV